MEQGPTTTEQQLDEHTVDGRTARSDDEAEQKAAETIINDIEETAYIQTCGKRMPIAWPIDLGGGCVTCDVYWAYVCVVVYPTYPL